ncbi:MAG: OstA-like protein [Janthinobacterium lividum]
MPQFRFFLLLFVLALPGFRLLAQTRPAVARPATPAKKQQPEPKGAPVDLLHTDIYIHEQVTEIVDGKPVKVPVDKLLGAVSLKQQDVLLYCDSAYQYKERNVVECFGHVRIVQSDTLTITGDHGTYSGNQRTARMTGQQVIMQDPHMTLTTTALDYDLNHKTAYYTVGGHLTDPKNTLDSQQGSYDTNSKVFVFKRDVHLVSIDESGTPTDLRNDTLRYNTVSKIAYFDGPTYIKSTQGNLYAEKGTYNTVTRVSSFERNAKIDTPGYLLGGDQLVYDQVKLYGVATGHVSLISKKDNLVLRGDRGRYWRALGRTKLFGGRPVIRNISGRDTLYLAADTLLSVETRPGRATQRPILFAWPKAQIFRGKMQGRCDSLTYDRQDSVIYLNRDPVIWQARNQLTSDSMNLRFRHGQLERASLFGKAFAIQEDTLSDYNQVKGRSMVALFRQNRLARVNVLGNAESIYFTLDGDTTMSGMNKSVSASMALYFVNNKINGLTWLTKAEATYTPVHELKEGDKQFKGFNWRPADRPTRAAVLGKHFASDLRRKAKPKPKLKAKGKPAAKTRKPKPKKATPPAAATRR